MRARARNCQKEKGKKGQLLDVASKLRGKVSETLLLLLLVVVVVIEEVVLNNDKTPRTRTRRVGGGAEQEHSLSKAEVEHDREYVTTWRADRYVPYALGFTLGLRFLRNIILCRLYSSPSDETVNQGPPCQCIRILKDHLRMLKIL